MTSNRVPSPAVNGFKRSQRALLLAVAVAPVIGPASDALAATRTWDRGAGTGLWSGILNWSGDLEPTATDPVILPTPIPGGFSSISLSATEHALNLTINANYALGANFLQLHGAGGSINVASGVSASISSALTGSVGITKSGGGSLNLTGANAFTGTFTLTTGTVSFSTNSAFGNAANTISLNGGTLKNNLSVTTSRTINIGVISPVIEQTLFWTQNGPLGPGSNPIQILGTGSFALNSASTRTGGTTIRNGTVRLTNGAALGTGYVDVANNGRLELANSATHGSFMFLGSNGTLRTDGVGSVHNGIIFVQASGSTVFLNAGDNATYTLQMGGAANTYTSGTGALTRVNGLGTITILPANDYAGDWQLDSAILRVANATSLGTGTSPVVVNNSATLQPVAVTFDRAVTLNTGSTLAFEGGGQSLGTHTVAAGAAVTLNLKGVGNEILGDAPNELTGGAGASINVISAAAGNQLQLNQPSDYAGGWTIGSSATVRVAHADALGTGTSSVVMTSPATLQIASVTLNRAIDLNNGTTLEFENGGQSLGTHTIGTSDAVAFILKGAGNATLGDAGNDLTGGSGSTITVTGETAGNTLMLNQSSNYAGNWTIGNLAAVRVGHPSALGSGSPIVNSGGKLEINNIALDRVVTLNTGGALAGIGAGAQSNGTITVNGTADALLGTGTSATDVFTLGDGANDLTGGAAGSSITVNGAGKVLLTQSSNYTGEWIISSGTLEIGADNQLGAASNAVTLGAGTLSTTASISSARTFTAAGGTILTAPSTTLTLTSSLGSGSGALIKEGSGILALSATSTRSGVTTINAGDIRLSGTATPLGIGRTTINSGAALELATASVINGGITLNQGGTLRGTGTSTFSQSGEPQVANGLGDVFIDTPVASDQLTIGSAIRSSTASLSLSTIQKTGNGTLKLSAGGTSAADIFGGSWVQSAGIIQVGQSSGNGINALGFKNGDARQANTITVDGGTLAVGALGSGANTPAWLRANIILDGGSIASTNGIDAQYGGDFIVTGTSKVLLFDPLSTATVRNVNLVAGAIGVDNLDATTTWSAGSTLIVDPGTTSGGVFNIARDGGTISVDSGATLQINAGATVHLAGTADALSDGVDHVNVVSDATSVFHIPQGSKNIGSLSGSGLTSILGGASLTVHQDVNTTAGAILGLGALIKEGSGTLTSTVVDVGSLTVNGGAVISVGGSSVEAGETVTVSGGSMTVPSLIDNGTVTVTSGTMNLDLLAVGNDGTLSGGSGTGQMDVAGGTVSAKKVLLGSSTGGNGTLVVKDGGTLETNKLSANALVVNVGSVTVIEPITPEDPVMDGSIVAGYVHDGLVVSNAGTTTTPKMKLGVTAGKTGTFVLNGGTVNITTLGVGNDGTTSGGAGIGVVALNGATPNVTNVIIGSSTGGIGELTLGFPGPDKVLKTSTLSIDNGAGNKLDLTDNKLIVTGGDLGSWTGSAYSGVTGLIARGRNGGVWDGDGITTSMADATSGSGYTMVGVATGSEARGIGPTDTDTWGGVIVTGSDALVMYTYGGDANLSGNVDVDDYGQIDFNAATGGVLTGWFNGDFDYSGVQDVDDYGIIDFVINIQGPPFSTGEGLIVSTVPEPTAIGLLEAAGLGAILRRYRRVRGG